MKALKITRVVALTVVAGMVLVASNGNVEAGSFKKLLKQYVQHQVNHGPQFNQPQFKQPKHKHNHGPKFLGPKHQPHFHQPLVKPIKPICKPKFGGPTTKLLLPVDPPVHHPQIKLGVTGYFDAHGLHVQSVVWGSYAQRVGIEPGDIISVINGRQISCLHTYRSALAFNQGHIDLVIWDVRGRGYISRTVYLPGHMPVPVYGNQGGPQPLSSL